MANAVKLVTVLFAIAASAAGFPNSADEIHAKTGVKGGLIVHVGCNDGEYTASLAVNNRFLVQGLDDDPAQA